MPDLIDEYRKSGLIGEPRLRRCASCDDLFHPDDLNEVDDITPSGEHITIDICDSCAAGNE